MDNPDSNNTSGGAGAPKSGQYNPRPRTQTHSQIHRLKQQDVAGVRSISEAASTGSGCTKKKPPLPATATKKPVKKIWGSITLPVLVFDVVTTDVVAHLLHQNNPKFKKHDWLTLKLSAANQDQDQDRESPSIKKESENLSEQQQQQNNPKKHSLFECEKSLRFQCMNLQSIYYRSFVTSVFKSLQLHQSLHSYDVQTAVDNCEENVEEIYFTDFVMKICNHIQIDMDNTASSNKTLSTTTLNFDPAVAGSSLSSQPVPEEIISLLPVEPEVVPNLDISFQSSSCDPRLSQLDQDLLEPEPEPTPPPKLLKVERILKGKSCTDQDVNQSVIKRKFSDILSNSFQLVPHMTDLYYFCPNLNQIGDDYFPIPSRMRRDTKETGGTGSSNVDESEVYLTV